MILSVLNHLWQSTLWLGGAANACVAMGAVQRAAASLRFWSSRHPYVRVASPAS